MYSKVKNTSLSLLQSLFPKENLGPLRITVYFTLSGLPCLNKVFHSFIHEYYDFKPDLNPKTKV